MVVSRLLNLCLNFCYFVLGWGKKKSFKGMKMLDLSISLNVCIVYACLYVYLSIPYMICVFVLCFQKNRKKALFNLLFVCVCDFFKKRLL